MREGTGKKNSKRVNLLGAGTLLRDALAATALLEQDHNISADVWSVTSFNELCRDGQDVDRWNGLHPTEKPRTSWVETCLGEASLPTVASTDYIKMYSEQIRPFVRGEYLTLGTDGYGRADSREALRHHFEVARYYIAVTALQALMRQGDCSAEDVAAAITKYGIDSEKPNPLMA